LTARPPSTPAARDDPREIGVHIGQDNPARAQAFVRGPREHCRRPAAAAAFALAAGGVRLRRARGAVHGACLTLRTHRDGGRVAAVERAAHGACGPDRLLDAG
jgi:plasmid stabilization system protein ParE